MPFMQFSKTLTPYHTPLGSQVLERGRMQFSTQKDLKKWCDNRIKGKTELQEDYYLDCKSAQKIPLFLPIVCSSEFIVRQFPCAVQSTEIQTKSLSREWDHLASYPTNHTIRLSKSQKTEKINIKILTGSCNSNENRSCVEGPRERLDKNGNVHAKM